jgi:hypothetical protein
MFPAFAVQSLQVSATLAFFLKPRLHLQNSRSVSISLSFHLRQGYSSVISAVEAVLHPKRSQAWRSEGAFELG